VFRGYAFAFSDGIPSEASFVPSISTPPRSRDHLSELNPAQREAVTTLSGPLLVLAGAGTGKTRVITFRMAELIRRGVAPEQILSVTFTNKAAREMQERTQSLLGKRLRTKPCISTFHAYCVRVLRDEIAALGYPPKFVIYDRGDQESAARKALRDLKVVDTALRPGDLVNQISRWKTVGVRADQASSVAADDREFLAAVAYRKYQATLRASGAVDFDDLLLLTLQLFEEHPASLERQQQRFEHVQIDEYQDTNELQFRIVSELVSPHHNLCVVGDDDQSIYGWRGAEIKHILGFQQQFPGAKVVRLQDNYRCTTEIIDVANRIVRCNRGRHEKSLIAHKTGAPVLFKPYPDEQTEAEGVVREVAYLINQMQVSPSDVAILFRTNEQPRLFESELRRLRVPYVLVGGQSFFDRREVRDLMAYLKVLAQPDDEVSLLRIINVPARGIGEASVEKLITRAVKAGQSLWDAVPDAVAAKEITAKTAAAIQQFRGLLADFRERLDRPGHLSEVFQQLVEAIDYDSEIQKQYKEVSMQLARSGVVDECVAAVREYERRALRPSLAEFLEETALAGKEETFGEDPEQQKPGVRLMTLHSAKGLEFPRVYLVGLEEGLLPHQRSVDADADSAIEEERRLAYVGITRAKDALTISWAQTRMKWGKRRETIPSRFLHEMQPEDPPTE
jgi:DNA helicase-2/ATP-dependent DNA helicase PcrA